MVDKSYASIKNPQTTGAARPQPTREEMILAGMALWVQNHTRTHRIINIVIAVESLLILGGAYYLYL